MKRYKILVEFQLFENCFNGKRLLTVGRYCHSFFAVKDLVSRKTNHPFILGMSINEFTDYCYNNLDFIEIKDVIVQKSLWR